mmetsp:Transcript_7865/g.8663  ORF Transcript_7865/g.8663 Transcript_7865/m.8663 type:complete len:277 (+) Transcript_7865:84-914(+)
MHNYYMKIHHLIAASSCVRKHAAGSITCFHTQHKVNVSQNLRYFKTVSLYYVGTSKGALIHGNKSTVRQMTTAYSGEPGDGTLGLDKLKNNLPYKSTLTNGKLVEISAFEEHEWEHGMELMNLVIREGKSWPFVDEFETVESYRGYFLSHAAFVVRDGENSRIMGCFYIKPNFPGRCSHICNGGFITAPEYRRMGVATLMGRAFLKYAKELGYKSSYFNLVFKSNDASVRLWEKLGFERIATLESAAELNGVEGLDTAYGYRFDLDSLNKDFVIHL